MSGPRLAVLVSEGRHSSLICVPATLKELTTLVEKLLGVGKSQAVVHRLKEADSCEELKDERSFQEACADTRSTLTLLAKSRSELLSPTAQNHYVLTFETRHKLRILDLEDESIVYWESKNLNWTGRACTVAGEKVMFTGGSVSPTSAFQFDLPSHSETQVSSTLGGHMWHGLLALGDSTYAIGGRETATSAPTTTCEVYHGFTWKALPPLTTPRESMTLTAYKGTIIAVGGFDGQRRLRTAERLGSAGWSLLPWELPAARQMPGVAVLDGELMVVAGGQDEKGEKSDVFEVNLASSTVRTASPLPTAAFFTGQQLFLRADNRLWAFGRQTFIRTESTWTAAS